MDKLKPHMMKTKCKDHQKAETDDTHENKETSSEESSVESGITDVQSQLPQLPLEQPQSQTEQQQLQPDNNNNCNKRKAMEEGFSPDRSRTRYNGLTSL